MDVQLGNSSLYYEKLGNGRPIVMLHGWSFDHRHMVSSFEPCFLERSNWQRLYLDLPGHGKSAHSKHFENMDDVLKVVLEFIDTVTSGRRFVLAGMSAGGYLAQGVVHHRSELMDGMLLLVPRILADDAQRILPPAKTLIENPELLDNLNPQEAEAMRGAVIQNIEVVEKMRQDVFPAWAMTDWTLLERLWQPKNWGFSFDVREFVEPILFPTLILTGRQDAVVGYQDALSLLEHYSRGTFAVLDRAGHGLEIEQKLLFYALVKEWLDRVEEYIGLLDKPVADCAVD